jgi:hypothetical protein
LTDVNHFLYTGGEKKQRKIDSLAPFCPSLGQDLATRNPFLGVSCLFSSIAAHTQE